MTANTDTSKDKFVLVAIASIAAFFGFQAASAILNLYQVGNYLLVSLYVYLFLVFWQSFVFDLHLKEGSIVSGLWQRFAYMRHRHHWLQFQNYLILPGTIYWTTIAILYLNPFHESLKQAIIVCSTLALTISFWYLKKIFHRHGEASPRDRQLVFLAKIYASYIAFASALGITRYFGFGVGLFSVLVFCITFLLFYQAFFQHHRVSLEAMRETVSSSVFLAVLAYMIFYIWNVNYYSAALVLTAFYNTIWGIIHHYYIDRNLTREIVLEYIAVLVLALVIVLSTTNFAERI